MGQGRQIDELYWVLNARTAPLIGGIASATRHLTKFAAFLTTPQGALAAVGVAAAVAGAKGTKMAAELDQALREVASILPGTVEDLSDIRDQIVALSTQVPQPPVQLTRAFYDIISAGIEDTTEAMQILEVAARAAVAGGLKDSAEAVNAITTILNAYQLNASDAQRVSDVLFETVNLGVIRFGELADVVGEVANTAALAGVGIEEIGAAISVLTQRGIGGAEAVTSLNRLLLALIDSQSKGAEEARKLGIEFGINAVRTKGLAGLMQELSEAVGDDVEALQLVLPEIRAFRGASVLAGKGLDDFISINDRFQNSAGATQDAFDDMVGSLQNQTQLLKNKVGAWFEKFGEKTLPVLIAALKELNRLTDSSDIQVGLRKTILEGLTDEQLLKAMEGAKRTADTAFARIRELREKGVTSGFIGFGTAEEAEELRELNELLETTRERYRALELEQERRRVAQNQPAGSGPSPSGPVFTEEQLDAQAKLFDELKDRMVASTRTATDDMQLELDRLVADIKAAFGEIPEEFEAILDRMRDKIAATGPLEEFSDRLGDIRERLAEFTAQGNIPGFAATAARLVELRGQIQAVFETLDPATDQWKEYEGVLRQIDGLLRQLGRTLPKTSGGVKGVGESAQDAADNVLLLTRAFIDLGFAVGAFDRNAAGALSSLANIIGAVETGLSKDFSVSVVAAIGSGLAGFLGNVLGGGGDSAAELEAKALEQERLDRLKKNTEAIQRLRDKIVLIGDSATRLPLGGVLSAITTYLAGPPGGTSEDNVQGLHPDQLLEALTSLGLTMEDVKAVAEALGIELDDTTGTLYELAEAIREVDLKQWTQTFSGQMDLLRREFELWDITDPMEQAQMMLDVLREFTGIEVPDLAKDGAAAVEDFIKTFFAGIGELTPEEMAAKFGGLSLAQILDLLGEVESAIDQANGADGQDQTSGGYRVSQGVTQVTGDLMVSIMVTQAVHLARIDRAMQEILNHKGFGGLEPPEKREIGDLPTFQPIPVTPTVTFGAVTVQVVSPDPARAGEAVAEDLVTQVNRRLSDALTDTQRAYGSARSE